MERHGSESYFVIGEGLLSESVGGRERTLAATDGGPGAAVPLLAHGADGIKRQLSEASEEDRARDDRRASGGVSKIPAGFTYLGQFVDHDLTFDKTNVMLGESVSPAELLQARSPSLDLDSLYGAGPSDPESAKFYESDGLHLKMGKTAAADGIDGEGGLRPAARRRDRRRRRSGTAIIPDRATTRTSPSRRRTCAFIRFHNRVVDTLRRPSRVGQRFAKARRARHPALPVDAPHGLPARGSAPRAWSTTSSPTAARRSRSGRPRPTSRRCRSSSRSPRTASGTR